MWTYLQALADIHPPGRLPKRASTSSSWARQKSARQLSSHGRLAWTHPKLTHPNHERSPSAVIHTTSRLESGPCLTLTCKMLRQLSGLVENGRPIPGASMAASLFMISHRKKVWTPYQSLYALYRRRASLVFWRRQRPTSAFQSVNLISKGLKRRSNWSLPASRLPSQPHILKAHGGAWALCYPRSSADTIYLVHPRHPQVPSHPPANFSRRTRRGKADAFRSPY